MRNEYDANGALFQSQQGHSHQNNVKVSMKNTFDRADLIVMVGAILAISVALYFGVI